VFICEIDHSRREVHSHNLNRTSLGVCDAIASRATPNIKNALAGKRLKQFEREIKSPADDPTPDFVHPPRERALLILVDCIEPLGICVKVAADSLLN
jgi:hypothetical protein